MDTRLKFATAAALCSLSLPAQVQALGGPGERAATTIVWLGGDKPEGGMCIQYGQPPWKADYDDKADKAKGQRFRLGKDWWTTFDTSKDVDFGGIRVRAGSYFLGLECNQEGKFKLDLMRAATVLAAGQLPIPPDAAPVDLAVPLNFEKGALKETVQKLTIALTADKDDPMKVTLEITWGKHRLSVTGKASVPPPRQGRAGGGGKGGKGGEKGGDGKGGEGKGGGETKGGEGKGGQSPDNLNSREPRLSVGVRTLIPGIEMPLVLDLGWPILYEESDGGHQLYWSFGRSSSDGEFVWGSGFSTGAGLQGTFRFTKRDFESFNQPGTSDISQFVIGFT